MINQDCKPGTQQFCFHLYQVWASELNLNTHIISDYHFFVYFCVNGIGFDVFFHDTLSCRCEALQKTVPLFCMCGAIGLTVFDCLKDPTTAIILKKKNFFRVSPFHVSLAHIQSLSPRHKTNSDSGPVPIYTGFLCALSNVGFGGREVGLDDMISNILILIWGVPRSFLFMENIMFPQKQ